MKLLFFSVSLLVAFLFSAIGQDKMGKKENTQIPPSLSIFLEQNNVEVGDSVLVVVRVVNNTAQDIHNLRLRLDGPEFLKLAGRKGNVQNAVPLENLQGFTTRTCWRF